jgi:hypothetical protein
MEVPAEYFLERLRRKSHIHQHQFLNVSVGIGDKFDVLRDIGGRVHILHVDLLDCGFVVLEISEARTVEADLIVLEGVEYLVSVAVCLKY